MSGWIVAAYLAGVIACMAPETGRWHWDELLALALWPITAPTAPIVRKYRRWKRSR